MDTILPHVLFFTFMPSIIFLNQGKHWNIEWINRMVNLVGIHFKQLQKLQKNKKQY